MNSDQTSKTIAFVDSGIGGIPYMLHALEHISGIRAVYAADTKHFPYGTMVPSDLVDRLTSLIERLISFHDPAVVVLACNTASVVALEELRNRFSIPFVGTVPAVKPAALNSPGGKIGIMATEQTLKDPYLDELIASHASSAYVTRVPATGLIEGIEHGFFDGLDGSRLEEIAEVFTEAGSDTVVLGCTHFIHLEKILDANWGDRFSVIDSREGISRQIFRLVNDLPQSSFPVLNRIEGNQALSSALFYISSDDRIDYYRNIAIHFSFDFRGNLNDA